MTNHIPNSEDYTDPNEVVEAFHKGMLDNGRTQMLRSVMDLLSVIGRFYKGSNEVTQETILGLTASYIDRMSDGLPLPNIDYKPKEEDYENG